MIRPPPIVDASLNLFARLCADDSIYRSTTVMQFGTTHLTGSFIAKSFADDALPDSVFMSCFVKCLQYDDFWIRPECFGYRIFLNPEVSILLPVLHHYHWSVYCINFAQSRIDVLDSMDYDSNNYHSWDMFHSDMGAKIMNRLSDALSEAAPHKFKSFKNWRHVQVKVPIHKNPSDSLFFAMKFLEYYDGEGHGSLKTNLDTAGSKELRAEMLYYITFHSENNVATLPDDLIQFRQTDLQPFFY
nr:unnamed protein product [Digitaria exilis]